MPSNSRPVGRPKTQGELAEIRQELKFKPSEFARLEEIKRATGVNIGTYIKRVLLQELDRAEEGDDAPPPPPSMNDLLAEAAQSGELAQALALGGARVPVLGHAPCGPFREVVAEVDAHHLLSDATAEWLEAGPRDVFIVCDGQSMEGAGIPNGALLMLRPLPPGGRPQSGEIVLIQLLDHEGNCTSTIKRWITSQPLTLHDGEGAPVELPSNLREAIPVAVARGIVSRI